MATIRRLIAKWERCHLCGHWFNIRDDDNSTYVQPGDKPVCGPCREEWEGYL